MAFGHREERCPERGCRTQDRADILRIRDAIETDRDRSGARRPTQLLEVRLGQPVDFDRHALVGGIGPDQSIDVLSGSGLRNRGGRAPPKQSGKRFGEAAPGFLRDEDPMDTALGVLQRRPHRVAAVQPYGGRRGARSPRAVAGTAPPVVAVRARRHAGSIRTPSASSIARLSVVPQA